MNTFGELKTSIQTECNDTSTSTGTFIEDRLDYWHRSVCTHTSWSFMITTATDTTVADQMGYTLPVIYDILVALKITVSSIDYYPLPIASRDQWNDITREGFSTITSDIPQFYFIEGNTVNIYPKPASNGNTITYTINKKAKKLLSTDFTDKTAGTVSITNGATAVTGSGTSFATTDTGRGIIFDLDGYEYILGAYTSGTAIALARAFQGTTISGGAYTIGTIPLIPSEDTDILRFYVLSDIWRRREDFSVNGGKSKAYMTLAEDMLKDLYKKDKRLYVSPNVHAITTTSLRNINNYPTNLS